MKFYVFPANKKGRCIDGFCPTVCNGIESSLECAFQLACYLMRSGRAFQKVQILKKH